MVEINRFLGMVDCIYNNSCIFIRCLVCMQNKIWLYFKVFQLGKLLKWKLI